MLNFAHVDITKGFSQIVEAAKVLIQTPAFIKEHQLWKGFWDRKWVLIFSIIIATSFSFVLYNNIYDYFIPDKEDVELNIPTEGFDEGIESMDEALNDSPDAGKPELEKGKQSLVKQKEILEGEHKPLFSSSLRFLLLIFLQVLMFHFAVRTNNVLKNENKAPRVKQLYKSQIRMVKLMLRKWIYGLIMYILMSILLGIIGQSHLIKPIMFFIYGYYIGFAFLDNYLAQFNFSIKESVKCIQSHFGASTLFGVFASAVMFIPTVGPLIVPFVCGIAATIYGHTTQMETFPRSKNDK